MMRWNDAGSVDESARQDQLVAAQIEQASKGPNRALLTVLSTLALAGVAGLGFQNVPLAAVFLSPSLLMFGQSLISTVKSSSSRAD